MELYRILNSKTISDMKHIFSSLFLVGVLATVASCDLFKIDNYEYPKAILAGRIIDSETGENIQTDVINGTTLSLIEQGYENPSPTYLRVKNDGSYEKALLFPGKYTIQPTERNFYQIDEQELTLKKGTTTLDFNVTPYVRITESSIEKSGNKIVARLRLEAPGGDAIKEIALFEASEISVGESIYNVCSVTPVNRLVGPNEELTVSINCAEHKTYLKSNREYYFRVGARSSVGGAKYNYTTAVKLNIGDISDEPEPDYYYFDRCDAAAGWGPNEWALDTIDKKEGVASIKSTVKASQVVIATKNFDEGQTIDANVSKSTGYFAFDIYVSDATAIDWDNGDSGIEITSGGGPDNQELAWKLNSSLKINNGWNSVALKLSDATPTGSIDLSKINFLRIYHTNQPKEFIVKLDNIRFYEPL